MSPSVPQPTPLVSVVIPTHNRAALLPRALKSVETQTFDRWEIILVDDGSTDETSLTTRPFQDRLGRRFRYVHQIQAGASAARNRGINESRGRFIAFLDSDDEFLPTKLEKQLALFQRCPDIGLVYSDYAYIDLEDRRCESAFDSVAPLAKSVSYESIGANLCRCTGSPFDVLLRGYFIATIVGMVRREVLGRSIRFQAAQSYAEEWIFYLQVLRICKAGFVNEPLSLHHHTSGSVTRSDKRRNAMGYRDTLRAILATFPDLNRLQEQVVKHNLAKALRQTAFDAWHAGDKRQTCADLVESLKHQPTLRTLAQLVKTRVSCVLSGSTRKRCSFEPRALARAACQHGSSVSHKTNHRTKSGDAIVPSPETSTVTTLINSNGAFFERNIT